MFNNLLEFESDVSCYIQFINESALEERLKLIGLKRDIKIVKDPNLEKENSISIRLCDQAIAIEKTMAVKILVRACEICWSCGECGLEDRSTRLD
jgi:hypothetical protein